MGRIARPLLLRRQVMGRIHKEEPAATWSGALVELAPVDLGMREAFSQTKGADHPWKLGVLSVWGNQGALASSDPEAQPNPSE